MIKKRNVALPALVLSLFLIVAGCGEKRTGPDEKVIVARIGNYEMTVEDFKNEADLIAENKYLSDDPAKAREEILDEMIVKKILLMEAQAQDFDKDKAFMKEIERYWEQALLKLLIKKKSREFSSDIIVREQDMKEEYERMLASEGSKAGSFEDMAPRIRKNIVRRREREAFEKWIADLRKKTAVMIDKKVLSDIKLR
ncbi:MAG: hypothetical protein PHT32_08295 [Candidatus Omnitrophica bacterium]|nr:hypothetical protein [Candidatus Omnitrophota bacterium]